MQLLQQLQEIVIKLICARRMNADDIMAHLCSVIQKENLPKKLNFYAVE